MPAAAVRRLPNPVADESVEDHCNVEVIRGIKLMSPRPAPVHVSVVAVLTMALGPAFDDNFRNRKSGRPPRGPGGWRVLPEPELHLKGDVLIADLAGWRTERLPSLPKTAYIAVAPDWVCEVLSPSTQSIDRHTKMPAYAAAGVRNVWLVSTLARSLEVFQLAKGSYELVATHTDEVRVRVEPFAELRLDLAALWP